MTMRRIAAVSLVLGLLGCPGFTEGVPRPPTYEECKPSDPFYWDMANATVDMAGPAEIPSDPIEAFKVAQEQIDDRKVKIIPKVDGFEDWSRFNTTFPDTIYTSKDYPNYSDAGKAAVLWHELVHVRQYDRHRAAKFFTMYAFAEGRWAIEVQAYRESYRVRRLWGDDEENIREAMRSRAEMLYKEYELWQMPEECAIQGAIDIWMQDSP